MQEVVKTHKKKKGNMYEDARYRWNVFVGCYYQCKYCLPSFQRQMKRQKPTIDKKGKKRGCQDCYDYEPHFHEERLTNEWIKKNLPKTTKGDEFIWACSSGDIAFAKSEWIEKILMKIRELSNRTFFFQSKNPIIFQQYNFPDNILLGTTLESNRDYLSISNAPVQTVRYADFLKIKHPRTVVTIEPIMPFDLGTFVKWIKNIAPERVYIGYDTKNTGLLEPSLAQTKRLISHLRQFTKVKLKYMKNQEVKTNLEEWMEVKH